MNDKSSKETHINLQGEGALTAATVRAAVAEQIEKPPMPSEIRTGDSVELDAAGNVVAVNGKPVKA